MQSGVVSRSRHFDEGECGGFFASQFPHIRGLGSIKLDHDGPDVSGAGAFGDGHKLTLDDASHSAISAHEEVNIVFGTHLERQFLTSNAEHAIAGGEVEDVNRVGRAIAVHNELKGLHPSTSGANTEVQAVDDLVGTVHVLHMQLVNNCTASRGNFELDVGTVAVGGLGTTIRTQIVGIGVIRVTMGREDRIARTGVVDVTRAVARR